MVQVLNGVISLHCNTASRLYSTRRLTPVSKTYSVCYRVEEHGVHYDSERSRLILCTRSSDISQSVDSRRHEVPEMHMLVLGA